MYTDRYAAAGGSYTGRVAGKDDANPENTRLSEEVARAVVSLHLARNELMIPVNDDQGHR
jgi:hypothetical protein